MKNRKNVKSLNECLPEELLWDEIVSTGSPGFNEGWICAVPELVLEVIAVEDFTSLGAPVVPGYAPM